MTVSKTTSVLPASWPQVLEKVRRALRKAETEARKREMDPALAVATIEAQPDKSSARSTALTHLLERRQQTLQTAERLYQETDARLAEIEEELRLWLDTAEHGTTTPVISEPGGIR
jgi:hypothetical protein